MADALGVKCCVSTRVCIDNDTTYSSLDQATRGALTLDECTKEKNAAIVTSFLNMRECTKPPLREWQHRKLRRVLSRDDTAASDGSILSSRLDVEVYARRRVAESLDESRRLLFASITPGSNSRAENNLQVCIHKDPATSVC